MDTILLTGGAGFIGSSLIAFLNGKGIKPFIYDTNPYVQYKNLIGLKYTLISDVTYMYGGSAYKTIIHLGAHSRTNLEPNKENYDNNVFSVVNLVKTFPCSRHIFASSASIYGNLKVFTEDQVNPESFYAFTKWRVENFGIENYPNNFYSLRFFNVFGARESYKENMASPVYKWLTEKNNFGDGINRLNIYQTPEMARDFIHVDDICEIIWFFMSKNVAGGIYNAGTGIASKWTDVANIIKSLIPDKCSVSTENCLPPNLNNYQYYTCANLTKLRSVGFDHKFLTLEEGIKKTYEKLK